MYYKPFILLVLITFIPKFSIGQGRIPDSLKNKSFEHLKSRFFKSVDDKIIAATYADTFIWKAKNINDTIKIADGYYYKCRISDFENGIKYADSIILMTKDMDHPYYPGLGYLLKGYFNYNAGNDKQALDYYLKANEYAVKTNNIKQQIEVQQFVGAIKVNMGDYTTSLEIHEKQLEFIENQSNFKSKFKYDYLMVLDNLSKGYIRAKRTGLAMPIIKKGLEFSRMENEMEWHYGFLLDSGNVLYLNNDFDSALDSINKAMPHLNDVSLAMCYYYKGKIFEKHDIEQAMANYTKVDSIYESSATPFIELPKVYKKMYDFYSEKKDSEQQLISVNKLLKVDSVLNTNAQYLRRHIAKDYEIPKLRLEKERLINNIENSKNKSKTIYILLVISIIGISTTGLIFYRKQLNYKKRYQKLISETDKTLIPIKIDTVKTVNLDISESVVSDILNKLEVFEKTNAFIHKKLTLSNLAKDLETNSSYLSKVINQYKNSSFSNYINDLRIAYAINQLKQNSKLRDYTIKAIAEDVGFNNAESFSNAFYKKTKLYPSFFIKQLNKHDNT